MSQSLRGLAFGRSLALLFLGFWSGITVTAAPRLFQLSLGGFLRVGLAHRLGERAEAAFVRIVLSVFRHDTRLTPLFACSAAMEKDRGARQLFPRKSPALLRGGASRGRQDSDAEEMQT